jgi:hypothetical protein
LNLKPRQHLCLFSRTFKSIMIGKFLCYRLFGYQHRLRAYFASRHLSLRNQFHLFAGRLRCFGFYTERLECWALNTKQRPAHIPCRAQRRGGNKYTDIRHSWTSSSNGFIKITEWPIIPFQDPTIRNPLMSRDMSV